MSDGTTVIFLDNWQRYDPPTGPCGIRNYPSPLVVRVQDASLDDRHQTIETDKGTFRRAAAYHEASPYGWERVEVQAAE